MPIGKRQPERSKPSQIYPDVTLVKLSEAKPMHDPDAGTLNEGSRLLLGMHSKAFERENEKRERMEGAAKRQHVRRK